MRDDDDDALVIHEETRCADAQMSDRSISLFQDALYYFAQDAAMRCSSAMRDAR
jgi:hypothetical protein